MRIVVIEEDPHVGEILNSLWSLIGAELGEEIEYVDVEDWTAENRNISDWDALSQNTRGIDATNMIKAVTRENQIVVNFTWPLLSDPRIFVLPSNQTVKDVSLINRIIPSAELSVFKPSMWITIIALLTFCILCVVFARCLRSKSDSASVTVWMWYAHFMLQNTLSNFKTGAENIHFSNICFLTNFYLFRITWIQPDTSYDRPVHNALARALPGMSTR